MPIRLLGAQIWECFNNSNCCIFVHRLHNFQVMCQSTQHIIMENRAWQAPSLEWPRILWAVTTSTCSFLMVNLATVIRQDIYVQFSMSWYQWSILCSKHVICSIVRSCKLQRLTVTVPYDETACSLLLLDSQLAAHKDPGPLQMNLLILSYTRTSYITPELWSTVTTVEFLSFSISGTYLPHTSQKSVLDGNTRSRLVYPRMWHTCKWFMYTT